MKTSLINLLCLLVFCLACALTTINAPAVLQTNSMGVIYDDLVWKQPGTVLPAPPPARPDFSDCDRIAARMNAETNLNSKIALGIDLMRCANQKIAESKHDPSPPVHFNPVVVTNLVAEPCITYHYYAITLDGGMKEMGAFADHDPLMGGWEGGNFDPSIRFILRSESPAAKLCVIRQMEQPNPVARFPHGLPFNHFPPSPVHFDATNTQAMGGSQTNHITKN